LINKDFHKVVRSLYSYSVIGCLTSLKAGIMTRGNCHKLILWRTCYCSGELRPIWKFQLRLSFWKFYRNNLGAKIH